MSQSRLFAKLLENEITDAEREQLNQRLNDDPELRRFYRKYMTLDAMLRWEIAPPLMRVSEEEREAADSPAWDINMNPQSGVSVPSIVVDPTPSGFTFVGSMAFSYMVATVVLCAMLLSAWAYRVTLRNATPDGFVQKAPVEQGMEFVARVTAAVDCEWDDPNEGTLAGAWVTVGRKYALTSGLVEITYTSGAKVILQGPCAYTVDSTAGGYLQRGKLTALLEERGEGLAASASAKPQATNPHPPTSSLSTLHSPLFTISTPTAVVTDLGTEFGVEVDDSGNTTSHVFQGIVKFENIGGSPKSVMLRKNDTASALIGPTGITISKAVGSPEFVRDITRPRTEYFRSMPVKDSAEFTWKYEMDVDPATQDLDANSVNDWKDYRDGTSSTFDGIMRMGPNGGNEYPAYCSAANENAIWSNVSHAAGFTFEIRVKSAGKKEWHGYTGVMYVRLSDENTDEYLSDLVIANEATLCDHVSKIVIDGNANNDGYHVFRVAQQPNSGQYYIWRDNKLIYTRNGLQEKDGALRIGRAFFGNLNSATGPSEVDYVRLTVGAYAPPPSPANQHPK